MLDYFRAKTRRQSAHVQSPILSNEDEQYFAKLAGEETPPALPARPGSSTAPTDAPAAAPAKDAQVALMDGADRIPLPTSPPAEPQDRAVDAQAAVAVEEAAAETQAEIKAEAAESKHKHKGKGKEKEHKEAKPKRPLSSYIPFTRRRKSQQIKESDIPKKDETKDEAKNETEVEAEKAKQENEDLTAVLDQLNLSAVNNRVFSFSAESQKLLEKFTLVLKDLVHGAPYAYDDLEKLLTREEAQLNKMFNAMPPFLQSLIKSLPTKIAAGIAPELMMASAEKPDDHLQASATSASSAATHHLKSKIPSLKSLVAAEGAVATALRSITNFLRLRFPALMTGTNVLLSLAVFILLFVFWYCHKRGRQERLLKDATDAETADDAEGAASSSRVEELKPTEQSKPTEEQTNGDVPITFNDTPREGPSEAGDERVEDLPSVLDLPSPATVPLPNSPPAKSPAKSPDQQKEDPLEAK